MSESLGEMDAFPRDLQDPGEGLRGEKKDLFSETGYRNIG